MFKHITNAYKKTGLEATLIGSYALYRISGVRVPFSNPDTPATSPLGFATRAVDVARNGYELGLSVIELPVWPINAVMNGVYHLSSWESKDFTPEIKEKYGEPYTTDAVFQPLVNGFYTGREAMTEAKRNMQANFTGYGEELKNYHWLHNSTSVKSTMNSLVRDIPFVTKECAQVSANTPLNNWLDTHQLNPFNLYIGLITAIIAKRVKDRRRKHKLFTYSQTAFDEPKKIPFKERESKMKSLIPLYGDKFKYERSHG